MAAFPSLTAPLATLRAAARRWGGKSILSVLDQGVSSGSNFILSLLLARWLAPAEYGGYAIAFSVFLFAAGFHNALILDPLYVFGAHRSGEEARRHVGAVLWLNGALSAILAAVLAAAAVVLALVHSSLSGALFALAIAAPFTLLSWVLRAGCYLEARPALALGGSLVYGVVLFAALLAAKGWGLSSFTAYLCTAVASLSAVVFLFRSLGLAARHTRWSVARRRLRAVASENWRYGRWVTGSAVVYWLSGTLYLPLLGSFAGLAQVGAFQAMQNLLRPLQQSATALSALFLPALSRQHKEPDARRFQQAVGGIVALNAAFAAAWLVLLLVGRHWLVLFLYRSNFYGPFVTLLPLLWLAALLGVITQGLVVGLKSVQRSDLLLGAQAFGAVATLTLGLLFVRARGIEGAAIGSACSGLVLAAAHLFLLGRALRGKR